MALIAILGDWGTTNVRLWAVDQQGAVLDTKTLNKGMSQLKPDEYEPILTEFIQCQSARCEMPLDIVLCGMAGARQGWCEAPYAEIGVTKARSAVQVKTKNSQLNVYILPGLKQSNPADVMRGEETQIQGFLHDQPGFSGTVCMPGTHSKWVRVVDGEIIRFQTAFTGELYALLKNHSTLGFAMQDEWDEQQFIRSVIEGFENSGSLIASLFSKRAEKLISDKPSSGSAAISGLLIGAEFAAGQSLIQDGNLQIIASDELAELYLIVAKTLGLAAHKLSGDQLVLRGLLDNLQKIRRGELCIEN